MGIPANRIPTHPGIILLEEFLIPLNITQQTLAEAVCVPVQRVNGIINGRRSITPSTALRLAKFFDNSPGFWMNLQLRFDLYKAQTSEAAMIKNIQAFQKRYL